MFTLLFIMVIIKASATLAVTSTNASDFLINCGLPKSQNATSTPNRVWQSDDSDVFSPPDINVVGSAASANSSGSGQAPYSYARIFRSSLTYSFPVTPGPKFIRLYFFTSPTLSYNNISASQSFLSLQANEFTLFHNFSAYLNSQYLTSYLDGYYMEFYVPIQKNNPPTLNLTFSSPDHGFINGIEIVSVRDGLYLNNNATSQFIPKYVNNPNTGYTIQPMTSFQTVYRLNVGGFDVEWGGDAGQLGRNWNNDDTYIFGGFYGTTLRPEVGSYEEGVKYKRILSDTAPKSVYASLRIIGNNTNGISGNPSEIRIKYKLNLTWEFWVDPGFDYLLRLHFCEMDIHVTMISMRVFQVYFNDEMADEYVDVWELSGGLGSPIYKDYIFHVYGGAAADFGVGATNATTNKAQLLLKLLPSADCVVKDVLLNGLEILKLNQSNGNLAAPNPPSAVSSIPNKEPNTTTSGSKQRTLAITGGAIGGSILVILLIACVYLLE